MAHPDTIAVHAGEPLLDRKDAPMTPDITVGSASGYADLKALDAAMAAHRGYGRWGTDNHRQLEAALASLEASGQGTKLDAVVVGSGMAAIAVALMSEMGAGDHLVAANDCYGTTLTFLRDDLVRFGITSTIVDFQDLEAVRRAVTDRTRVLLCEMCTNPLIRVPELEALASIAHDAGALLLVDNTVPTSSLSQPLRWGADVVIYSATKNLSGHADVIGGAVVGKPAWIDAARAFAHTFGPTLGPFDAGTPLAEVERLADACTRGGMPTTAVLDARGPQWRKVIFNASTNPIGALTVGLKGDTITEMGELTEAANSSDRGADRYFSREEQDAFASRSHQLAAQGWKNGLYDDEVVPVAIPQRKGEPRLPQENCARHPATLLCAIFF